MASILLIDDDIRYLDGLSQGLRSLDHSVTTATTSSEGLSIHANGQFDIAICDVIMSGGGALSFLHEIRKRDSTFPIVIITGREEIATSPIFVEGMRDADAKIEKTASLGEIDHIVKSLLS